MATCIPGKGRVAKAGLSFVIFGRGEIKIPPVSVCHHVSTIGQFSFPMFLWYQYHASSLIGSQTEPRIRRLDKSYFSTQESASFAKDRMAVGAV